MRVLFISGHGANDPGACSSFGVERDEARRVVNEMNRLAKNYPNFHVDIYPQHRNCYDDVRKGCVQVNFANYDYVFEVHFNSASPAAQGTEIWVVPTEKQVSVEEKIVNKLAALGFRNRGVKREYFAVINNVKKKGVSGALVEVCFISNQSDMQLYKSKFTQICNAMVEGIAEGFGLVKNPQASTPTTPAPSQPQPSNGELCRILVNGKNVIALTGLQKCIDHVKQNYSKEEVKVQRVSDGAILWTQAKYTAPSSQGEYIVKEYAEKGTFYPNTTIYFRNNPLVHDSNPRQGTYSKGEYVVYDKVVVTNKYVYISWIGGSGTRRYMPIRERINNQSQPMWGTIK